MGSFGTGLSDAVCMECGAELTDELSCTECGITYESQQRVSVKRMKSQVQVFEEFQLNETTAAAAAASAAPESTSSAAKRKRKLK